MKKVLLFLIFAVLACHAQFGVVRNTEGIHVPSAFTMKQGHVYIGQDYQTITDGEPLASEGFFEDGRGIRRDMDSDVPSSGAGFQIAYALMDNLEISGLLPFFYEGDIDHTSLGGLGLGDIQVGVKSSFLNDFPVTPGFSFEVFAPTGFRSMGFRPRQIWYYGNKETYAYTSGGWAIASGFYLTVNFSDIVHWNNFVTYMRSFGNQSNYLLWGSGLEVFPYKMISVLLEASGETKIREKGFATKGGYDPLRLTPGLRLHLPHNTDIVVGVDIGLDMFRTPDPDYAHNVVRNDDGNTLNYSIYGSPQLALTFGVTKTFDFSWKDSDRDGVYDRLDMCPNTGRGMRVNKRGCPVDEDQDGVLNIVDDCPGTPYGVAVDYFGCPLDNDKDGVPNYLDMCPYTPAGMAVNENGCMKDTDIDGIDDNNDLCPDTRLGEPVDSTGCPLDADRDGVPNDLDKCPDTPEGLSVDNVGCPLDFDKDGVPDDLDKCPDSEPNEIVKDDGCPLDTDGDGVPDSKDKCAETPKDYPVDEKGCPRDTDEDGVPDALDKCSGTPKNAPVDSLGCLLDTDKDGIPDYKDKCSMTLPKVKVDESGCAENSKMNLDAIAKRIVFSKNGKSLAEPGYTALNDCITLMRQYNFKLEVIAPEKEGAIITDFLDMKGMRDDLTKHTVGSPIQLKAFDLQYE